MPFLPGKKSRLDPKMLFELDPASADKKLLKDLCVAFYAHPNPEIRKQCTFAMAILPGDKQIAEILWLLIERDPEAGVRRSAVYSLVQHHDHSDIPRIVQLYYTNPTLQATIDEAIEDVGFEELRQQINASITR